MKAFVGSYTEEGCRVIPPLYLSDEEYGRGLQCFVPACADIVPIDEAQKVFYLALRISKPMTGWWWIGGRMIPYETKEEAAARNFRRETGLELSQKRFKLAAVFDYRWKDRAQEPQHTGCHMLGYTFVVELTSEELDFASRKLIRGEYEKETGLVAFDKERLEKEKVFPAILDLYNHVFSSNPFDPEDMYSRWI